MAVVVASLAAPAQQRPSSWNLARGDRLGEGLTVVTRLGTGRKSEVYLAWDRTRRSAVAAKLPRPGEPLGRYQREAGLFGRVTHPLLVRGLDAALDQPRPHLILEHVEGPSLRELLREGPLAPRVVAAIGHQLAAVLHYLSGVGFAHLDVKPHNVLLAPQTRAPYLEAGRSTSLADVGKAARCRAARALDEPPVVKLIDLGAVRPSDGRAKGAGKAVPELGGPDARATPAASVWLLGSTMRLALGGEDRRYRPQAVGGSGRREPPRALAQIVAECLREEPSERPSAEEVAVALEPLAGSGPRGAAGPGGGLDRTR